MADIARGRRKTLKKQKEKQRMAKNQTIATNIFLLLLFYIEKYIFCWKTYLENLYVFTFILQSFQVAVYWKCNNKIPTPIQICTGFVDAVLRPKILGNRLGILT